MTILGAQHEIKREGATDLRTMLELWITIFIPRMAEIPETQTSIHLECFPAEFSCCPDIPRHPDQLVPLVPIKSSQPLQAPVPTWPLCEGCMKTPSHSACSAVLQTQPYRGLPSRCLAQSQNMLLLKWQLTCKALILHKLTLNPFQNIGSGTRQSSSLLSCCRSPCPLPTIVDSSQIRSHLPSQRPLATAEVLLSPSLCLLLKRLLKIDGLFHFYFIKTASVSGVPKATPCSSSSLGELLTVFSVEPYSWLCFTTANGYKAKSAKGKVHGVKSRGVLSQCNLTGHTKPFQHQITTICEMFSTRETPSLNAQSFHWGWSSRHPPPSLYQNCRLPKGKHSVQEFKLRKLLWTTFISSGDGRLKPSSNPGSQMPVNPTSKPFWW